MFFSKTATCLIAAGVIAASVSVTPSWAAYSSRDITNAIYAADVLDAGAAINVRVDGDKVYVATYRNPRENENDTKINAVLIAKAAFAAAGDAASRVTVYFYGKDMAQYQSVSVTAGDVKAYGSGETSQEQLLKGIVIETKQPQNDVDKITAELQSTSVIRPDYKVVQNGTEVMVSTALGDWVPDDEAKVEALKIAKNAIKAASGAQTVRVVFTDPKGGTQSRQIIIRGQDAESLWGAIQGAMHGMQVAQIAVPIDVQSLQVADGVCKDERSKLLTRIKDLDKRGIGMGPFVQAYLSIEKMVPSNDEAAVRNAVNHLGMNVDDQEKAYRAAKEAKVTKAASSAPVDTSVRTTGSRWGATGTRPIIEDQVVTNPDGVVHSFEAEMAAGYGSADNNPKFLRVLDQVVTILHAHGNSAGAARFEQRAAAMRNRGLR